MSDWLMNCFVLMLGSLVFYELNQSLKAVGHSSFVDVVYHLSIEKEAYFFSIEIIYQ